MRNTISDDQQGELLRDDRTVVSDELRSLVYFTEETVDQLYLRGDFDQTDDLVGFAGN